MKAEEGREGEEKERILKIIECLFRKEYDIEHQ